MELTVQGYRDVKHLFKPPKSVELRDVESLSCSGIYLFTYTNDRGETLFYVGRSRNLRYRLNQHKALMSGKLPSIGTSVKHTRAAVKYASSARCYLLETLKEEESGRKDTLAALEKFWILYFWKQFGAKATLNVEIVPTKRRFSEQNKERLSEIHRQRFAEAPEAREFMSAKVRKQWQDPEFRQINSNRVKELFAAGFKPKNVVLVVKLPDKKVYTIRQKTLATMFKFGCRVGGLPSLFADNVLLSDWRVSQYTMGWKKFLAIEEKVLKDEQELLKHPFIRWCLDFKESVGSKWISLTPLKFSSSEGVFKARKTTDFMKGGKILHEDGRLITRYETLFDCYRDRTPWYGFTQALCRRHGRT